MTANEIYLKIKSVFKDAALPKIKSFTHSIGAQMANAGKAVAGVNAVIGEMPGALGKAAGAVGRLVTSFMTLGPVGAIVAGASMAIDALVENGKKACDEMVAAAQKTLAAVRAAYARQTQGYLDKMDTSLQKVTKEAARTARAFDDLAASYLKIANAKSETAAAGDSADIAKLKAVRSSAMNTAGDQNLAARIGAGYDVKIAERIAQASAEKHARAVAQAGADAQNAATRAGLAKSAEDKAKEALDVAKDIESRSRFSSDMNFRASVKAKREAAEDALLEAQRKRAAAETDAVVALEKQKQALLAQSAAIDETSAAVASAKKAYSDLVAAQKKAAAAEVEKNAIAAKIGAANFGDAQKFVRGDLNGLNAAFGRQQARVAADEQAKANAWALYKSPEAMKAKLQEEKDEARAQARFKRDSERLQRRADWRTARLGRRDEATRRMILAQEQAEEDKKELKRLRGHVEVAERKLIAIADALDKGIAL